MNIFEKFSFDYFEFVKKTLNETNQKKFITKSFIHPFDTFIYKKYSDQTLSTFYDSIIASIYNEDLSVWLETLYNFCTFIRTAEKCFMYENCEDSDIYVEFLKDDTIKNIFFKDLDFKCKVSFEATKIPTDITGLMSIMFNEESPTLTFINFEIVREFGKQMCNKFRFISGEYPKFNDKSDEVLFYIQKQRLSIMMEDIYNDILSSIFKSYNISIHNYYWKEVITDGIWVRR